MMKAIVREYIGDPVALKYLDNFIELMPEGLSKGLRSSQGLANLYLSAVDKIMCQNVSYHTVEIDNKMRLWPRGAAGSILIRETRFIIILPLL